ncbi:glycine zipper 2TM domain-containing protein [Sphingosinithalassobacter portus]|uniref:glycine zipper 2TM domain-containing protein n=1 Tax=Stakelama portus TaxID=2676234 RepID=UPI000D6E0E4E|nr:glycine zipper 2TM domain-containing protein [Sphingosinithalassobacter portus]
MRITFLAAAAAALTLPAMPAAAQHHGDRHGRVHYDAHGRAHQDNRHNRNWRGYRHYDWNRVESGQRGYYADRYYRDGRYYQPRRLTRNDRIYRGSNGRYYCRRSDGTTGLIVGGVAGALLGNSLTDGRSATLGTLLGAAAGAAIGREIDRGNVVCR